MCVFRAYHDRPQKFSRAFAALVGLCENLPVGEANTLYSMKRETCYLKSKGQREPRYAIEKI